MTKLTKIIVRVTFVRTVNSTLKKINSELLNENPIDLVRQLYEMDRESEASSEQPKIGKESPFVSSSSDSSTIESE